MEFLSRLLSSLLLIIALPAYAYIPDQLDMGYSSLSETKKYLIRNGVTIPYNTQFVRRVVVGKAKIMPNGAIINIPHGPDLVPSLHDLRNDPKLQHKDKEVLLKDLNFDFEDQSSYLPAFLLIHALDVYSTYKGLKYDCVSERNPLVGRYPSLAELLLFKTGIIIGLEALYGEYENDWKVFQITSAFTTGIVVHNNFDIIRDARNNPRCKRR